MSFKDILLPQKLDLDVMLLTLFAGVDAGQDNVRFVAGSASGPELADPDVLCVEVGGSGMVAENCFDHHSGSGAGKGKTSLSAAAQFFERVATLFRYVDEVDCGKLERVKKVGFPSLLQLVSGMLFAVKDSKLRLQYGHAILRAVLQSGINPYEESMEAILDKVPGARSWAEAKRLHEERGETVMRGAQWFTTAAGKKLAAIETDWIGAPGALYGCGADVVVALNPRMEMGDRTIAKFTIASPKEKDISVRPVLAKLEALEIERSEKGGWGGPNHGTIIGSPQDRSSSLLMEEVVQIAQEML
jgi:hypothetical protein